MTNKEWIDKGQNSVMNTYGRFPITFVKGKGSRLWDADGKEYLDFVGGIATCLLGHSPDILNQVLVEQADKLWHVSNLYWNPTQIELAEKLTGSCGMDKAFFCNSGAEANEAAIKLARKYHYRKNAAHRQEIIAFEHSFHGRTLGALTATGQAKYHEGFAPLVPGFKYARFNDLDSVKLLLNDQTAAVIVEPVQGEGGIKPADGEFLTGLKELCEQQGILLIFDEVQCGMGRLGSLTAGQLYGVTPHILTLAKGLGGGFPIGAMLATEDAASGFAPGDHASTFGGNPLATAVACQVIETITAAEFLPAVQKKGQLLKQALQRISDPRILEVRGEGLLLGAEFDVEVRGLIEIAIEKGLLLVGAGPRIVRFVPALTVNENDINQAINIFNNSLREWTE